ncbi:pectate lyase-like adhesive domain-containing protein [Sedimentibacter sp. B4]|uniref:pectate lyase-like adhesive domain-containing protein n=1 Tax=Sedimentibacter sp. B4 TaxID=304766 RepID=UPI0002EAD6CF|nr:pectate lyase-like adhesive domain-containing protein [Sedimentibacter sp. B4]
MLFINNISLTSADVANLADFKAAVSNTTINTINLTGDITTAEELVVSRAVTINGNGHAITFTGNDEDWQGNYVLQIYNTTGVAISNIKLSGADGGLLVNASAVTLTGTINVSDNEFGGIEVSKGTAEGLPDPSLTATGVSFTNTSEKYGQPTIWEDKITRTVTVAEGIFTLNYTFKSDQVQ